MNSGTEFERYREYLLFLANAGLDPRLRRKMNPSDVVQQSLMDAHRKRAQFHGSTDAERACWLRQILANNLIDALRAFGRQKRDVFREKPLATVLEESSQQLGAWLEAEQSTPSQRLHDHEQALQLANVMSQLPDAQREALVLQNWHGWSLFQIAAQMNRTESAVAGLLKRGLKQLRQLLKEESQS